MNRQELYEETLINLKQEHDALKCQYEKAREKYVAAKSAIIGISQLLDVPVEEEYQWSKRPEFTSRRGK